MRAATCSIGTWARLAVTIHDDGRPGNGYAVLVIVDGRP